MTTFVAKYGKKDAKASVQFGYAQAEVMYNILKKACDNKDLTREGIVKASRQLSGVDTGGLIAGRSTTRRSASRRRARSTSRARTTSSAG